MGATEDPLAGVIWHDALELGLQGQGWVDEPRVHPYDRMPQAFEGMVDRGVWRLSTHAAGQYVEFASPAVELFARWHLLDEAGEDAYMSAAARNGLDSYGQDTDGSWYWIGQQEPWQDPHCHGRLHRADLDGEQRRYRVYLPLLRRVARLEIGSRAPITPVPADDRKPIVYYGTSIVHGAGVGRAGMAHAAQLGRRLGREVVNLGFCGKAKLEPIMAEVIGRLDPVLFLVDALPNNTADEARERLPAFLRILRTARPATPILLVEDRQFGDHRFAPTRDALRLAKNAALHAAVAEVEAEGMTGLHLASHGTWFGDDGEGTVDASHPNDLGAWRMAEALHPYVAKLVGE